MHSTRLVWLVLPSLALSASAQVENTNKSVRLVSLAETLDLALNHNLNLRIERLMPQIARYNIDLARAGYSARIGQQGWLTQREGSYDPTFFVQGTKTYDSTPNVLTYSRQQNLQRDINQVNDNGFESAVAAEQVTQTAAARDLIRANGTIRTHSTALSGIDEDLRLGRITPGEAQTQRAEEQARYENAVANSLDAQSIIGSSASRLSAAQARDGQTLARLSRAQTAQNFLNDTPIGGEIPASGVLDPETGYTIYNKEVTRTYNVTTGLRGGLPIGTVYELRVGGELDKSTYYNKDYVSVASITVGQPLLRNFLTDEARTLINTSKKDLQIAEWSLQFAIMDTLTRAQQTYYDVLFAQENVRVQEKAVELAERFLAETTSKVKAGLLPPLDQKQAQSQAAMAQADLVAARRDLAVQENTLKNLITDDYAQWQNVRFVPSEKLVALPETYDLGQSWSKALQQRPEYNQARLELEKQNIILKFRKNQMLPSLDLVGSFSGNGFSYQTIGKAYGNIDGNPSYFFGGIFSMPLFNRDAKSRYKLTQADKEKALLQMKRLEQDILTQVDNNLRIAQADYSRIDATRQARLFAEAALELEQQKLLNGLSTAFTVLELQKNLTAARFAEINALTAYNKALAQLYFSEGTTLERHNIRLQVK